MPDIGRIAWLPARLTAFFPQGGQRGRSHAPHSATDCAAEGTAVGAASGPGSGEGKQGVVPLGTATLTMPVYYPVRLFFTVRKP